MTKIHFRPYIPNQTVLFPQRIDEDIAENDPVGNVRTKMYLCHSEILMPKDTESLGNNKAPACESRGFVRKKQKVCILTHLHSILI